MDEGKHAATLTAPPLLPSTPAPLPPPQAVHRWGRSHAMTQAFAAEEGDLRPRQQALLRETARVKSSALEVRHYAQQHQHKHHHHHQHHRHHHEHHQQQQRHSAAICFLILLLHLMLLPRVLPSRRNSRSKPASCSSSGRDSDSGGG